MQGWITRNQRLHASKIVGIDGLLELSDLLQGLDVGFEFRPARKPIETCDLELRVANGCCGARLEQIPGLLFQMSEIGSFGQWAWCPVWVSRDGDLLSTIRPVSAHSG